MSIEPRDQLSNIWIDIGQLLTREGKSARFVNFITGNAITENEGFTGKKRVLEEIEAKAVDTGIVIIQAGHRTGKTSLLLAASDRLQEDVVVVAKSYLNLQRFSDAPVTSLKEMIDGKVYRVEGTKYGMKKRVKKPNYVVVFDEVESYSPSNFPDLVKHARSVIKNGNIVLFGIIGDLSCGGEVPGELGDKSKTALLELAGKSMVINPLMSDDEIRDLVSSGATSVFTEVAINYLIRESGGHPFLAAALATELFSALNMVKAGRLKIQELPDKVQGNVVSRYCVAFESPVRTVFARGFNPLTWEYIGPPEYQPNVGVYRNMLPRESSSIFRGWLEEYLKKKV